MAPVREALCLCREIPCGLLPSPPPFCLFEFGKLVELYNLLRPVVNLQSFDALEVIGIVRYELQIICPCDACD